MRNKSPIPCFVDRPARVLIVDDERHNRDLFEAMLAPEGFHLLTASSGEEALALVAQQPPDLILLDVMMPGLDGYRVTAKIKGDPATTNIPVIIITALNDREARMLGLNAGAEDFLTKPVDRAELCARVRNLLRLKAYGDHYGKYSEMLEGEVTSRTADLVERTGSLEQQTIALGRSEARMSHALRLARMGVWELDVATQRITWSATMAPIFGVSSEEAPADAEALFSLIHPDDRTAVEASVAQAASGAGEEEVEFRLLWPDGSTRWLAGRTRMLVDPGDRAKRVIGIGTDISDRKSLESQFRQAQKMEAVGQLAGGVAHDFNNLLSVILGYSAAIIDTFPPGDARRADVEQVLEAGQRAAALTRQLLAFSRKQVLQPTALDLNALVTGMREMLGRLIGADVTLITTLAPNLGTVRGDSRQLEQVLMNLVVNAKDAMPAGGRLTIETTDVDLENSSFHEEAVMQGRYVMIAVTDTGGGMTRETQRRVFEPFFTTKEVGKGTGLGLSTVYGIVKQSKGYIWVYSEPGMGTTFKVYLPRWNSDVPVQAVDAVATAPARRGSETVLLVEDQLGVRRLARRILEKAGYRVFEAENGDDAERLFADHAGSIDLLVTDVIMPRCGGPELVARLRATVPALRVLYMSGYSELMASEKSGSVRGLPFIEKPFTAGSFVRQVREALDRPEASTPAGATGEASLTGPQGGR